MIKKVVVGYSKESGYNFFVLVFLMDTLESNVVVVRVVRVSLGWGSGKDYENKH